MNRFVLFLFCLGMVAAGCGRGETLSSPKVSASSAPTSPPPAASSSPSPSPTFDGKLIKFTYRDGVVSPDLQEVEVKLGQKVRIEVDSDRAEELHVHAYDKKVDVVPGQIAVLEFTADIPGAFEVELEKGKVTLFELTVK